MDTTFAALNVRERKKRRGIIGSAARISHPTNAAIATSPAPSDATISVLVQPSSLPRTRPHTRAKRPALTMPNPGRSSRLDGPRVSVRRVSAIGIATRPIGTLIQKIACQARPSAIAPPTSGPIAIARPAIPPQAPRATARRSGGTAADRIVRLNGVRIAPPRPWIARATISVVTSDDNGGKADRSGAAHQQVKEPGLGPAREWHPGSNSPEIALGDESVEPLGARARELGDAAVQPPEHRADDVADLRSGARCIRMEPGEEK